MALPPIPSAPACGCVPLAALTQPAKDQLRAAVVPGAAATAAPKLGQPGRTGEAGPPANAAEGGEKASWPVRLFLAAFAVVAWPFVHLGNLLAKLADALVGWLGDVDDLDDAAAEVAETSDVPVHLSVATVAAASAVAARERPGLDFSSPAEVEKIHAGYLARMAQPGEWGGHLELAALANLHRVNIEVWRPITKGGTPMMECKEICTTDAVPSRGTVAVMHHNHHYQAMVATAVDHLAPGAKSYVRPADLATVGEDRGLAAFKTSNVRGQGDCMFLAVAFAVGVPYVREFTRALHLYEQAGKDIPSLAPSLARARAYLGAGAAEGPAVLVQAVNALAADQRGEVVTELRRPRYADLVLAAAAADHADD